MSGARNLQAYLPGSPIVVDAPNGDLRVEWRHFFAQLWERTGGSQGTPPGGGGGTITGVTAGAGLSGGGTSGVVTLSQTIPVTIGNGGTGATTAPQALQNLGGISDAPSNSLTYGRFNAAWAQVLSLQYGGIIQGPTQLLTAPILPNDVATKAYVDAAIAGGGDWVDAPSDGNAWGRQNATWAQVLPLVGGTLSGTLHLPVLSLLGNALSTALYASSGFLSVMVDNVVSWQFSSTGATANGPLAMGTNAITALANPVNAQDAATKAYVDANAGGIADAPSDGNAYGRLNAAWSQVLPLAGGTLSGGLNLPSGSVAVPALGFGVMDGTGLFRSGTGLGMSLQGIQTWLFNATSSITVVPLDMRFQQINNLADPVASQDALNLQSGDARYMSAAAGPYLPLAGGTLTGALTLAADGAANLAPVTVQQFNGVIAQMLPLTGGTLTGPLVVPNGTAAVPSLAFGTVDGTGLSRSANALVLSVQGATVQGFFGSAGQFFVQLIMLNNKITQLGDATAAADALNLRTADARYAPIGAGPFLPLAGGTMTGPLTLAVDGSTALMPVTVQQFNLTVALLAPLASPALTGTPTAPTAPAGTNSTRIATTAYADNLNALTWG